MSGEPQDNQVVVMGAGPAGLTAAYELTKHNVKPIVLEAEDHVGGLACTQQYKGFFFDMGGHRFYTKAEAANQMWQEVLGDQFIRRPRLSRIYYGRKFFPYPLKPLATLRGLGLWQSILIILSFLRWQIFPYKQEETFEQWVTNRFGKRLFEMFFKSYTEKVWGIPCSRLKAEWAAQRIKDLSFTSAVINMFIKPKTQIKTLIEEFHYPRQGPGMMWNAVKSEVEKRNGEVRLSQPVLRINRSGNHIDSVVVGNNGHGEETIPGSYFISSIPVSDFVKRLSPAQPDVLAAAEKLTYRDFITVCLIVDKESLFPDNWIYIHEPAVQVGRIQNFKNWSPDMVPDLSKTSLGLEYFCTEGDETWTKPDAALIEQASRELEVIGLAKYGDVIDGCVFRMKKAYPIYDESYRDYLATVRTFVEGLENFQTIGRNGLHRYNNMDHAMVTGMLAVRNHLFGEHNDIWNVNTDMEYQEEVRQPAAQPAVGPLPAPAPSFEGALTRVFAKIDPLAFGLSTGIIGGVVLAFATLALVMKGGPVVGPNLQLLNQFFPGYTVSIEGSLLGFLYTFLAAFLGGWLVASLRNLGVFLSAAFIRRYAQFQLLRKLVDR